MEGSHDADEPTSTIVVTCDTDADAAFDVEVASGADTGARAAIDSHASALLVGTSTTCGLRLKDPAVSRRHASLESHGGHLVVRDLASRNGTFCGGVRIGEAFLRGGETLRLGDTELRVSVRTTGQSKRAVSVPRLSGVNRFGYAVGASVAMRRLFPLFERLAASDVSVVIEGETGTGKEVLARSLHEEGPRAKHPFVVFDCTAVAASLLEAELFGHVRGAFTGAVASRRGVFEQAHGGTLFLDEIGDLELAMQPKLLRAIERREVRPVGSERVLPIDVRLVAATRRDLDREVEHGRFRDDLFHRLAVTRVSLPPLRERVGDVVLLAKWFWRELGGAGAPSETLLARWESAPWTGNVRELRNAVARQLALGDADDAARASVAAPSSQDFFASVLASRLPLADARQRVVDELERRYLTQVLAENGGSVTRAAEASKIARRHFHRLRAKSTQK